MFQRVRQERVHSRKAFETLAEPLDEAWHRQRLPLSPFCLVVILVLLSVVVERFRHFSSNLGEAGLATVLSLANCQVNTVLQQTVLRHAESPVTTAHPPAPASRGNRT